MRSLFVIHASIWDVVVLALGGGFVVLYFILWALEARRQARRK